jgi:MYXO-CTERM domain-containing protein
MFDDRDAQYLIAFVTAGEIQTGRAASDYIITSARVTATIDPRFGNAFAYDGTKDAVGTYREPFQTGFRPDTDAGRPIELFGTGYNAGFNAFSYNEQGPFSFGNPAAEDVRIAYAADFDENGNLRNVSNNVRDNFETNSFAVGTVDGLAQGEFVPGDSTFSFDIDLSSEAIRDYLARGLSDGILSFSLSSLHVTTQNGPTEFPGFYTNDSFFPNAITPTLELTVQVVPAPAGVAGMLGLGLIAARRRRG